MLEAAPIRYKNLFINYAFFIITKHSFLVPYCQVLFSTLCLFSPDNFLTLT